MLEQRHKRARAPQSPDATPPFTLATPTQQDTQNITSGTTHPTTNLQTSISTPKLTDTEEPTQKKPNTCRTHNHNIHNTTKTATSPHQGSITQHLVPQRSCNQPPINVPTHIRLHQSKQKSQARQQPSTPTPQPTNTTQTNNNTHHTAHAGTHHARTRQQQSYINHKYKRPQKNYKNPPRTHHTPHSTSFSHN